jgi:hypothetical protein
LSRWIGADGSGCFAAAARYCWRLPWRLSWRRLEVLVKTLIR